MTGLRSPFSVVPRFSAADADVLAGRLKALADPVRLRILALLAEHEVLSGGALVQMIQLQRQFEMQVKVIRSGDEMAQSSNQLLRLGG